MKLNKRLLTPIAYLFLLSVAFYTGWWFAIEWKRDLNLGPASGDLSNVLNRNSYTKRLSGLDYILKGGVGMNSARNCTQGEISQIQPSPPPSDSFRIVKCLFLPPGYMAVEYGSFFVINRSTINSITNQSLESLDKAGLLTQNYGIGLYQQEDETYHLLIYGNLTKE